MENQPGNMKNQPGTMKNHENRLGTMENRPGTINKQKRYKQTDRQNLPIIYRFGSNPEYPLTRPSCCVVKTRMFDQIIDTCPNHL